jgi:FkbM family methyltransferase
MSILSQVLMNIGDMWELGFDFPVRHVASLVGLHFVNVNVRGAGKLTMRCHSSDARVVRQIFRTKEYDLDKFEQSKDINRVYEGILASGKTPIVIDAGANMGASALWFSKRFPQAHVVAVEPEPANAALCRRNIAGLSNVTLIEAALGGVAGSVNMTTGVGNEDWAFQTTRTEAGGVPVVTIPDIVAQIANGSLFCVKIDIEGFESDVFASNVGWLDQAEVVIVEPHDWMLPARGSSRTMQVALAARPFEMLISGENLVYVRLPDAAH